MARSGSQFMIGLTLLNVGILAVHLFTASARADGSIVTASEVRIVDADGVVRARLGPDPENQQPCLALLDRKGTVLLEARACDWGATGLSINDRNGAMHTYLAVNNHGDPSLSLYGGSGLATENLASDEGGGSIQLEFEGEPGRSERAGTIPSLTLYSPHVGGGGPGQDNRIILRSPLDESPSIVTQVRGRKTWSSPR
jgi:hypothetical protein